MEAKSKLDTFIGFCIRANKYKIGLNALNTIKKAKLVLVCGSASENTVKEAIKFSEKFKCPCYKLTGKKLEEIVYKENAKIMAVTDKDLAQAIISLKDDSLVNIK